MNNRIQQKYNDQIASLMGEIMDSGYGTALLNKQGLTFNTYEEDKGTRITEVEIGKGKATRKFTLASYCDNRFCWHHDVFGSIAQLPVPRLKQIAVILDGIVATLLETESKPEKKPARPRPALKTPARTRKPADEKKPPRKRSAKAEPDKKPPRSRKPTAVKKAPARQEAPAT